MEIASGLLAFIIVIAFLALEACAVIGSLKRKRKIF